MIVTVLVQLIDDVYWWIKTLESGKNSIKNNAFKEEIFLDASSFGWGVYCNTIRSHGFWSQKEKDNHHINYLELLAVFIGLKCFAKKVSNCSILCRVDNTTALSYTGCFKF